MRTPRTAGSGLRIVTLAALFCWAATVGRTGEDGRAKDNAITDVRIAGLSMSKPDRRPGPKRDDMDAILLSLAGRLPEGTHHVEGGAHRIGDGGHGAGSLLTPSLRTDRPPAGAHLLRWASLPMSPHRCVGPSCNCVAGAPVFAHRLAGCCTRGKHYAPDTRNHPHRKQSFAA
jgi:hypothetical protein